MRGMWQKGPRVLFNRIVAASAAGENTMSQDNHPAFSPERQALRARHGVRAVSSQEEGHVVKQLPAGIYGFTAAPAAPELPLFTQPIVRCTEVHKTADGEVYLIAYVDPAEASRIESGSEPVRVSLYPDPRDQATVLVALPMSRIGHRQPPARDSGNFMVVEIGPKD